MIKIKKVFFKDLININVKDNNENFISLKEKWILCQNKKLIFWDELYDPWEIIVREWIYNKLLEVNKILKKINIWYEICVIYWYRSIDIQTKKFLEILKNKTNIYYENPIDLYEEVHKNIAIPNVSWHPTWWAVDVLIFNKEINNFLDFWSYIYDFSIDLFNSILNKNISKEAYNNRVLLNKVMTEVWFAPYYWEYWHFSYWDKERAFYYNKQKAIYNQKIPSEIKFN